MGMLKDADYQSAGRWSSENRALADHHPEERLPFVK